MSMDIAVLKTEIAKSAETGGLGCHNHTQYYS